jgi:hypothetical protein
LWVWIDVEVVAGKVRVTRWVGGVQQSVSKVERESGGRQESKIWVRNVEAVWRS